MRYTDRTTDATHDSALIVSMSTGTGVAKDVLAAVARRTFQPRALCCRTPTHVTTQLKVDIDIDTETYRDGDGDNYD